MEGPDIFAALAAVRDHLGALPGVATSKIGLEANMTPDDYPMVRVVPSEIGDGPTLTGRTCGALIYFGEPIHEFTSGLEDQWRSLLAMEADMKGALRSVPGVKRVKYIRTTLDEDRIDAYKLLAMQVEVHA